MKRIIIVAGIIAATGSNAVAAETYRLVHAIDNDEAIVAKGLDEHDCQRMKKERAKLVALLGVGGSVTCLPESLFDD